MSELIIIVLILLIVVVGLVALYYTDFFGTSKVKIPKKKKEVDTPKVVDTSTPVTPSTTLTPVTPTITVTPSTPVSPVSPTITVTPVTPSITTTPATPTTEITSTPSLVKNPSDYRPFSELASVIEPSILPMAKEDYNRLMLKFFEVLNKQSKKLDLNSISEMSDTSLMAQLSAKMMPYIGQLQSKYTPQVAGTLLKYFACKHVTIILDNYYTGPPINIVVPDTPMLGIKSFPFTYKSKTKGKLVNASTLAPYKYFSYNIPSKIRKEVSQLYDSIIDRYMDILNSVLKSLPEVNNETVKSINVMSIMQNYRSAMEQDFNKIQQLFGANVAIIVKSIFTKNILPLLNAFYKGPGIDLTSPPGPNREVINIRYPNINKDQIFTVTSSPFASSAVATTTASPQFASSAVATTAASSPFASSAVATTAASPPSPSSSSSSPSPTFSSSTPKP